VQIAEQSLVKSNILVRYVQTWCFVL